ncbi:MAG: SusC/RagA family TonB-linked outer membrane protein, partial [Chitinophagaceae bacterium]
MESNFSGFVSSGDELAPISDVTVVVKGTRVATRTNEKGFYRITVPVNAVTLIFSAVGVETLEEVIGDRSTINVRLRTSSEQLNEIVITALGTRAERDKFASSAATVKGASVARSGETSLLTGLSAKTAGVLITRNGGDPGAGAYIQIRGQNTINGNIQPLFVVDGIPVSNASDNLGTAAG